jgi:hypothetical protein
MANDHFSGWSQDNILVLTAATVGKKGNGINAVIGLLQDLLAFQDKVNGAIEAQDLGDNKQKLEKFQQNLGDMYGQLLDMAKGGVRSVRQTAKPEESQESSSSPSAPSSPVMMDSNVIHKLP